MRLLLNKEIIRKPNHPQHGNELWVALCLEVDIAAQGLCRQDAIDSFERTWAAQYKIDTKRGVTPFYQYTPAPQIYWDTYETHERDNNTEYCCMFDPDEIIKKYN